jgi:hypothetical protein
MKKQLLLLVSILLPLISSCNVEPIEKPTVEPSEEIYYIDGLASNLFVTEVPENVKCIYLEDSDSYIACAEGSYAYKYAKDNNLRISIDIINEYRNLRRCQYFGEIFKRKIFQRRICKSVVKGRIIDR